MSNVLNNDQVDVALGNLPAWRREGTSIVRDAQAEEFLAGVRWVDSVADLAEQANHHPDIDIRYTTVTFRLSTHSEGGVTEKDLDLAARIDDLID